MSIEKTLADLTAAITDLTAAIKSAGVPPKEAAGKDKPARTPSAPAEQAKPADTPATAPAADAQSSKAAASETKASAGLDFNKDIGPKFIQLIRERGEAAGRKLIGEYDGTKTRLSEAVKPAQYPDVLARIEALLAGGE